MKYKIDYGLTQELSGNGSDDGQSQNLVCNNEYLPTVDETRDALGDYGIAVLSVGGILTLILYGLFAEQVYYTYTTCHKVFRRHIIWITSVYPFMTMMSVIGLAVPRANSICSAIKVTYMSIGISHFMDLTTGMFGSERAMLAYLEGTSLNIQVGPFCCWCKCLPSPPVNKIRIRIVRWLLWQMPYTQAIYFILNILWTIADSDSDGTLDPSKNYLWLNVLNFTSFISGVYALQIMAAAGTVPLEHYGYAKKAFALKTLVLVTKMQAFIFDVLAVYQVFPCILPYISPKAYKTTLLNSIYLVEMLLLGPYSYFQYHNEAFISANPKEPRPSFFEMKEASVSTISKSLEGPGSFPDALRPHKEHSAYVDMSAIVTQPGPGHTELPARIVNENGVRENMI